MSDMSKFIKTWRFFASKLRGHRRNLEVYQEMQQHLLVEEGLTLKVQGIKNRIAKLSRKYREERTKVGTSGAAPFTWEYYGAVHEVLGGYANTFCKQSIKCSKISTQKKNSDIAHDYDVDTTSSSAASTSSPLSSRSPSSSRSVSPSRGPAKNKSYELQLKTYNEIVKSNLMMEEALKEVRMVSEMFERSVTAVEKISNKI